MSKARWNYQFIKHGLLMLFIGMLLPVQAEGPFSPQAFFRDATGHLSIQQVEAQNFIPYQGVLSRGYDKGAIYWIRLSIPASQADASDWVIRVKPVWHDKIQLFDSLDGYASVSTAGDLSPWMEANFYSYTPAFRLPASSAERNVFLRLETLHSIQAHIELLPLAQAERVDRLEMVAICMYLGVMLVVFLWIVSGYFFQSDHLTAAFASTQLVAMLYSAIILGILRLLLDHVIPNIWLHWLHIVTVIIYPATAIYFYIKLLGNFGLHPLADKLLHCFILLPPVFLLMISAGLDTMSLELNALSIALFSVSIFFASLFGLRKGVADANLISGWFLKLFFTIIFFIGVWGTLPLLGVVSANQFSMWLFLLHGPILTACMGVILILRRREHLLQQERALKLAVQLAEHEKMARAEQSQLLSMMNHEIKTPMTVLKLLLSGNSVQPKAEAQIDTVTSILERCMWLDHLQDSSNLGHRQRVNLGQVVMDAVKKTQMSQRFHVDIASDHELFCDEFLLGVAVANLIENSLKYSKANSIISVNVFQKFFDDQSFIYFDVINEAGRSGLPDASRLFEKFYRAEAARNLPGTGIGLYLVKTISSKMGGQVECKIEINMIRFRMFLPC